MANKIVQLINEDNDNVYPLAGGMAADSIDTEMLKDSSVTSDKVASTTIDLSSYKTAKVTSLGARQLITIRGGIGVITTGGTVMSSSGDVFDNIPVSVPYVQELSVVTSSGQSARVLIMDGTNPGTSKISINAGAITYPAGLYISGAFPVN